MEINPTSAQLEGEITMNAKKKAALEVFVEETCMGCEEFAHVEAGKIRSCHHFRECAPEFLHDEDETEGCVGGCCGCPTDEVPNPYPLDGLLSVWPLKKIVTFAVVAAIVDAVGWFAVGFFLGHFVF